MPHYGVTALEVPPDETDPYGFVDDVRSYRGFGRTTEVVRGAEADTFVNEFWTARQRQAHSLHEISYRACFKPQLPAFFIERLTRPGDVIYDPFMGRGTTPLQAVLMGRTAFGADINPLSLHLVRPRIDPPRLEAVAARLDAVDWAAPADAGDELLAFYHPETLAEILALRRRLIERERAGLADAVDGWIRMVAMNRLTGHSPGFFSVYSLPPNQAVSAAAQRRINEKRKQTPPRRCVRTLILKKSRSLLADGPPPRPLVARLWTGPADHSPGVADGAVDLIVTSPPFLDIVQYAADNWLRCWFAGIGGDEVPIAVFRNVEAWTAFVARCFAEFARIVRPGGHVAFEVGEVRRGGVKLETHVVAALKGSPFAVEGVLVNQQKFTKTANCWGVGNNERGTNTNRIVVARRL